MTEVQRVADFFRTLEQFSELQTGEDVLLWQDNTKELFRVNADSTQSTVSQLTIETNLEGQSPS